MLLFKADLEGRLDAVVSRDGPPLQELQRIDSEKLFDWKWLIACSEDMMMQWKAALKRIEKMYHMT